MKNYLSLFMLFLFLQLNAQIKEDHCGTDAMHLKLLKQDPEYKRRFEKNNADWEKYATDHLDDWKPNKKMNSPSAMPPTVITLNVVFHDLSSGSSFLLPPASNVTDYQYILDRLNLIYNGTNIGGRPAGNDTFINFCLAKKTQTGDTYTFASTQHSGLTAATNIDRTDTAQLNSIVNASTSPTKYNPSKYINVYIVDDIQGAVAGFASLPPSHGTQRDGIFIERQFLVNNAALVNNMNVLAHEMGHYLGLLHTFGLCETITVGTGYDCSCDNNNCLFNGDMVCDTPPNVLQQSGYTSAANFPNTCHTDAIAFPATGTNLNPITTDLNDPKDNYMDYGIWSLQNRFTQGQIMRMQFMIDPLVGPRKSLLGQAACANCVALNNCTFTITPSPIFPVTDTRHEITQVGTNTPSVQFSLTSGCIASLGSQAHYNWTLELLDTNTITTGTGSSYTTTSGLAVGNYLLTLTATLNANAQCTESVSYNFVVIPQAGTCILATPTSNTATAWTSLNWNRISFTNGWFYNGSSYPAGSQHYDNTQALFDTTGFDVIPLSAGGSISTASDPVLGGVALPATANISNVFRVGKRTGGGATAFYAKRTITVNRNNCRFRVWVLGATQGSSTNTKYPFNGSSGSSSSNDAAFGMLTKLRYNSPVNTITSTYNATTGYDDTSGSNIFSNNVIVSQKTNLYYPGDFPIAANTAGFHRMTAWKSYILDYSEYVDLNPDTEVTLTFFSHSNVDANALQNAYAYYGIECLGGGIPQDFNFDIPDTSISCSSPGTQSCVEFPLPNTRYLTDTGYVIYHNNSSYLFDNVQVFKRDPLTGILSTTPYPITFPTNGTMKICLDQQDAPFQDFRIVYKTLHKTVTDDFRLYIGFYNNIADCTTGDVIDTAIHPNLTNGDILLCGLDNLPTLNLTATCITAPFTYQWYRKSDYTVDFYAITDATSATLQLVYNSAVSWNSGSVTSTNNYNPYMCNTYIRKIKYIEPYCNNPKTKTSEEFHVYNRWAIGLRFANATDNDICFGDTYNLNVLYPMLTANTIPSTYGCALPSHFNADLASITNHLTFQLFDPATNQPFGNVINYNFNGVFADGSSIFPSMSFSFNNINPATGNSPLFVPTSSNTSFPISIMVSGDYLGCTINGVTHTSHIQDINFSQSAVGGHIDYNCATNSGITSTDDGVTYGGYAWEYSTNNITFTTITGATLSTLSASIISTLPSPVYIRRRSNGTGECLAPKYSNVVFLSAHPSSVIFSPPAFPTTICKGSTAPILSNTSSNGILGTWNVATASNQATGVYTFTPLEGYCLPPYTYNLTVIDAQMPTFTQIGPFCAGTNFTLPPNSNGGAAGTWSPAIDLYHTKTYTFTPTSTTACSTPVTMTVVINPVSVVSFANSNYLFSPICYGSVAPILPSTDDNGVAGTWNQVVSNTLTGVYIFTPTNSCIPPASFTIPVLQDCGFTLSWGSEVSCENTDPRIKYDLNIVDGPCLRVCENSQITYELHGNISSINHTDWNITGGTLLSSTNSTCEVQWNNSTYCSLQGVIYLNNGTQLLINKCIEKLEAPNAAFAVFPLPPGEFYSTCVDTPTYFENYSYADNGDDDLYYNWYFSDGTTSNEFEPVHVFSAPGVYTVTLIVSNGCSCVGKSTGVIYVDEGQIKIQCPSVVCEGNVSSYSIDSGYGECQDLNWEVEGGTVVSQTHHNTEIQVIWNNVGPDGFGYVSVSASSCSSCVSKVKIPVIKQVGTIKGDLEVCEKTQNIYSLPQWPTTDFHWSLDAHGTGASLIQNFQRNEIILNSNSSGTVDLYCTYNNTLLNCGGTAHLTIRVNSSLIISGETTVCQYTPTSYQIQDSFGNPITTNPSWTVTGPGSFEQTGTANPFSITFPSQGTYYISSTDPTHCSLERFEVTVIGRPSPPTTITGPMVVCPGIPVTYSCIPPAGVTAHWSVNTSSGTILGSATGNSILVNFITTATTPFVVSLWYEKEGCLSNTITVYPIRDVPNLTVTHSDTQVCGSSYGDYAVNNSNADSYTWSIVPATAGSIESGQNSPSVHILWNQLAQIAQVKLEINKCGKLYTITPINVTIINAPAITITGSTNICSQQNAAFSFTQNPAGTFTNVLWDFGDGDTFSSSTATSTSHQYQTPTNGSVNYTVTATVSGGNGCLMNAVSNLNVIVSPSPVVAISPVNGLNLCDLNNSPGSYTYTVTMQGGFAATDQIKWYKNGSMIQNGTGPSASTINVQSFGIGTYYATVTNSFNCTSNTQSFQVYSSCGGCTATQVVDTAVTNNGCQAVTAHATLLPAGYTSAFWQVSIPGATIISSTPANFEAENVPPGEYPIRLYAFYDNNGQNCSTYKERSFIIPYKADLKYQVSCGTGNTYQVKLLDFSTYYAQTPATQFWFSVDNGTNWYVGTAVSGIYQFSTNLSPGNYQLGIRIARPGYDSCEKFIPLSLPNLSSTAFTYNNNVCVGRPVQFTVTNPQPGNQYLWDFGDNSLNLQQNPVKTFTIGGVKLVTLTILNQFGCSVTSTVAAVNIINSNMGGNLTVTPPYVCQGGTMGLHFNTTGSPVPVQYTWYQNAVSTTPFATTTVPNLNVTQNGQYLVYLKDSNGCELFTTRAASVAFTPLPQAPVISGNSIVCVDSPITLKVPANNSVIYEWKRDGVSQAQWYNYNTITDYLNSPGIHIYSVTARVLAGGTTYCSSAPGTISVNAVALPEMPVLSLNVLNCEPYQVSVEVTNPQSGAGYYWSNGDVGNNVVMTHDGPLQVRAVINECFVKTQLDLPVDLQPLSWVFPKGCYQSCGDKPLGYILGPLGSFEHWDWIENEHPIHSGSGSVPPLVYLAPNANYSMNLDNGYCNLVTGSMSVEPIDCVECKYSIEVRKVTCVTTNGQNMYQVLLTIHNPNSTTNWGTFAVPNGEGYFTPITISLPPGNSTYTVLFTGLAGFHGGPASILMNSVDENGKKCSQKFTIEFPENCETIEECRFGYKIRTVNCVKIKRSSIYHIAIEITNPYGINATTVVSVPPSYGTIAPTSFTSPSGMTVQHFYFYPAIGFSVGALPITITHNIGTVSCTKVIEIDMPELCPEVKKCEFGFNRREITCNRMPNGEYAYTITTTVSNPYGTPATINLAALGGQGTFVPNVLNLPIGSTQQTFVFYPANGFSGGLVHVQVEGHYKDDICLYDLAIEFPRLCCPTCKVIDLEDPKVTANNLLVLAPNPVNDNSIIYYNFANSNGSKIITLTDLLGRTLQEWDIKDNKGTITVDCARYAQGHYLIVMKQNNILIENTRMIKN